MSREQQGPSQGHAESVEKLGLEPRPSQSAVFSTAHTSTFRQTRKNTHHERLFIRWLFLWARVPTILGLGGARLGLVPLSTLLEAFPEHWSCLLWSFGLSTPSDKKLPKVGIFVSPATWGGTQVPGL